MRKVMGQLTLSSDEKMRLARRFNDSARLRNSKVRISLLSSAKQIPLEVIHDKRRGLLGSEN